MSHINNDQKYKKYTPYEHVKAKAGMYIGNFSNNESDQLIYDLATDTYLIEKNIKSNNAALKCADEILVNTIDQYSLSDNKTIIIVSYKVLTENDITKYAKINQGFTEAESKGCIKPGNVMITIRNTHNCVPLNTQDDIEINGVKTVMYKPQLIFGELYTTSNYENDSDNGKASNYEILNDLPPKLTGGINGLGAKLTNIYSKLFEIECYDGVSMYKQQWYNRMKHHSPPEIIQIPLQKYKTDPNIKPNFGELKNLDDKSYIGVSVSFILDDSLDIDPEQFKKGIITRLKFVAEFCTKSNVLWIDGSNDPVILSKKQYAEYSSDIIKKKRVSKNKTISSDQVESSENIIKFNLVPNINYKYKDKISWNITIGANDNILLKSLSCINGVIIPKNGIHMTSIIDQIIDYSIPKWYYENIPKLFTEYKSKNFAHFVGMYKQNTLIDIPVKSVDKKLLKSKICVYISGYIHNPQYTSQTKEEVTGDKKFFNTYYKIPENVLENISKIITPVIGVTIPENTKTNNAPKFVESYYEARGLTQKIKHQHYKIFICEGDSAMQPIVKGLDIIHDYNPEYNRTVCSVISNKGVPRNMVREIKYIEGGYIPLPNGFENFDYLQKKYVIPPNFAEDNKFWIIIRLIGLEFNKYYFDISELKIKEIIIATDQDDDGKGNIRISIAAFFIIYWPELLLHNFIKVLRTPLIKIYTDKDKTETIKAFYDINSYNTWIAEGDRLREIEFKKFMCITNGNDVFKYTITDRRKMYTRYFKGLSTLKDIDVTEVFTDLKTNIIQYVAYTEDDFKTFSSKEFIDGLIKSLNITHPEQSNNIIANFNPRREVAKTEFGMTMSSIDIYLNTNSDGRKYFLKEAIRMDGQDYYKTNNKGILETKLRNDLDSEYRIYASANIVRHMPDACDGATETTRKVWAAAMSYTGDDIKVCNFAGDVSKRFEYHHGPASMEGVIMGEAMDFPGSREILFIKALSQCGTRDMGGKVLPESRYFEIGMNKNILRAMFPVDDDPLLVYQEVEGKIVEPVRYIPLMPLSIMENYVSPCHGWKTEIWGRDYKTLLDMVLKNIAHQKLTGEIIGYDKTYYIKNSTKYFNTFSRVNLTDGSLKKETDNVRFSRPTPDKIIVNYLPPKVWTLDFLSKAEHQRELAKKADNEKQNSVKRGVSKIQVAAKGLKKKTCIDPGIKHHEWVESDLIINNSTTITNKIEIIIPLKKEFVSKTDDELITAFKFKKHMNSHLNLLDEFHKVREFRSYGDVFTYWYCIRIDCYKRRIMREKIKTEMELILNTEQVKFINEYNKSPMNNISIQEQIDRAQHKFKLIPLNSALIRNIGLTPIDKIKSLCMIELIHDKDVVITADINYDYITSMRISQLSINHKNKLIEEINKLEKYLETLNTPSYMFDLFESELLHLDECLKKYDAEREKMRLKVMNAAKNGGVVKQKKNTNKR